MPALGDSEPRKELVCPGGLTLGIRNALAQTCSDHAFELPNQRRRLDIRQTSVQYRGTAEPVHCDRSFELWRKKNVEVTKALAALQPLYGKDNVEIVTLDGQRVRGIVRSMKTTQALTTPSVKMECSNGEIVKIPFPSIAEIKDHNGQ